MITSNRELRSSLHAAARFREESRLIGHGGRIIVKNDDETRVFICGAVAVIDRYGNVSWIDHEKPCHE